MSLCMCIGLIQNLYAQEFPSTYEMYDIYISSDLYRISRDYVHHDKVVFRAPYYNKIAEIPCNEGYGEVAETYTSSKQLYVVFDGQEYPLEPNGHVTIEADAGFYNVDFKYEFISAECETSLQTSHSIQVKQHPEGFTYLQPDDVWEIELPELYEPPVVNPYPANSSWAKYNEPSQGKAIATIKLGDGNSELTRPLIFVDGVDFAETVVIDPNIGKPVRYGSTGWENVSQGLLSGVVENFEDELFKDYPKALTALRNDQTQYGEANYDIILVEFLDGADYIQKCAKLLQEVIKKVNEEKVCGYDNVLLGLSMGGQVSRFALSYFEAAGIDHGCREYVSFDSPHINANIPLAVQAFVYAGAKFQNSEAAQQSWHALNRPAAAQMLKYNLMAELEKGTIEYNHTVVNFSFLQFDLVVTESSLPFAESFPKIAQLRAQFYNERSELSLPKMTYNVAIANGSAFGQSQPGDICLAAVHNEADQSLVLPPVPLISLSLAEAISAYLTDKYEDDLLRVELNAGGSAAENIFVFNYINQDDYSFNKIHISNSPQLEELDLAPGCMRNDIQGITRELNDLVENNPLDDPLGGGWFSEIFVDFDLSLSCGLENTTFMNTASTLGIKTDDYSMNLDIAFDDAIITSPFDAFFYPDIKEDNEPHVEVNEANRQFLLKEVNENIMRFPSDFALPSDEYGSKYNFAHQFHRLNSITLNKNGVLAINDIGFTGFIDVDPQSHANSEFHDVVSSSSTCSETTVTINNGGRVSLGAATIQFRSGNLLLSAGSDMVVNNGGQLFVENKSQLRIAENSQLLLNPGSTLGINGEESELVLEGKLVTKGDVTIQVNGKIIIEPTATFDLGGKLTIIGDKMDDVIIDMRGSVHPEINQNLHIENGTILSRSNSSLLISNVDHVELINVRVIPHTPENSFTAIEMNEVDNITMNNVNVNSFCQYTGILIDGAGTVNVLNSSLSNSRTAIRVVNFDQMDVRNSRIFNGGFSCPSSPGIDDDLYEYSNGLWVENGENLSIQQTEIDGYGSGLPSSTAYGVRIDEVSDVKVEDSEIHNNGYGIYVPKNDGIGNKTNLHIARSTITENNQGVFMHGRKAQNSKELNYGLLTLECASFVNNYYTNVKGEDLLVQADIYFTEYDAGANAFEPSFVMSAEGNHYGMNFDVEYYQYSFVGSQGGEQVYLRGNFWLYDEVRSSFYSDITESELEIIADPMLGGNQMPSKCISIVDPTFGDDLYCENCIKSNDEDCAFILNEDDSKQTVNDIYTSGINAYRHNLSETEQTFASLAAMNQQETFGLLSKCQFQYQVSRVFAKGEIDQHDQGGISPRSSISEDSTFMVYPNPSSESIMLDGLPTSDIMIVSSAGQILMHFEYQEGSTVDISNLPSGLYTIVSANTKSTQRFIVIK